MRVCVASTTGRCIAEPQTVSVYLHSNFYRAMHFSAKRGIAIVCCPSVRLSVRPSVRLSVCLSVTIRYRDHIGWNSSKIISRPNSLRPSPGLTPKWAIWCNGNTPKIGVEYGWGHSRAQKTCNISETVQDKTKVTITD